MTKKGYWHLFYRFVVVVVVLVCIFVTAWS